MADAQAIKPLSKTRWSRRAQCEGKLLMLQPLTQCRSFIHFEGDNISQVHSAKSMLLMHITYRLRSDTVDMSLTEQNASKQLQQCAGKSDGQLSGWVVKTGRQGVYYLHEESCLAVQNLGAAKVAMQVFSQINQGDTTSTEHAAKKDDER